MSKFIELTKLDGGNILVAIEQIIWVADDVDNKSTIIYLINKDMVSNIKESAKDILTLINQ